MMIPIYSERLVSELNKANINGLQYLPLKILRTNGNCLEGFSITNILNYTDAFDYEKSAYNRFSQDFPNPNVRGEIAGVMKFVLKEEKLQSIGL